MFAMSQNSPKGGSGWVKTGDVYENFIKKFAENSNIIYLIKGESWNVPNKWGGCTMNYFVLPSWLIKTNE